MPHYSKTKSKNKTKTKTKTRRRPDAARVAAAREKIPGLPRFSEILDLKVREALPDRIPGPPGPEPFADLGYEQELKLKNAALQEFWRQHGLPDKPNQILPSPKPRKYRTTTKRRVVFDKGRYRLDFLPGNREGGKRLGARSLLEPDEHEVIYAFLLEKLNQPAYAALSHALNFLVIRGDYQKFSVIFNVSRLNAGVVRKAKMAADHLQELAFPSPEKKVMSAFLFFDPEQSPFYLDQRSPEGPWKLKKLFGPDRIRIQVGDRAFAFHPTSFCQVNGSILPAFLEKAEQLLKPRPEQRLLDLYCGFGFFTFSLARHYSQVLGAEVSQPSMESALEMAAATPGSVVRFRAGRIQARGLEKILPPADRIPEAILLDPPRQGTEPGVIKELAERAPVRVVHIFCDMETLPREVSQWRKSGYMVSKVVPLDMFPGTDNLEVMVLFLPDRYGILNRIAKPAHAAGEAEAEVEPATRAVPVPNRVGPETHRNKPARPPGDRRPVISNDVAGKNREWKGGRTRMESQGGSRSPRGERDRRPGGEPQSGARPFQNGKGGRPGKNFPGSSRGPKRRKGPER